MPCCFVDDICIHEAICYQAVKFFRVTQYVDDILSLRFAHSIYFTCKSLGSHGTVSLDAKYLLDVIIQLCLDACM